jgi:hypothetical protein
VVAARGEVGAQMVSLVTVLRMSPQSVLPSLTADRRHDAILRQRGKPSAQFGHAEGDDRRWTIALGNAIFAA